MRLSFCLTLLLFVPNTAFGDFLLGFDPDQLTVVSNGSEQVFSVDVIAIHDGQGANTISGFTLDVGDTGTDLTLTGPATSPFTWSLGPPSIVRHQSGDYSIGAAHFSNHALNFNDVDILATVQFVLPAHVENAVIPLDLSIRDANRDGFFDISSEVGAIQGQQFVVNAIPEPSGGILLLLAILSVSQCLWSRMLR